MDGNFLSLKLRTTVPIEEQVVKLEEDEAKDTVYIRGSAVQSPFSNKVPPLPQFMPYKTVHEEGSKMFAFDPLASSSYVSVSSEEALDANHKTFNGLTQPKNFNTNKQGSISYATTGFPVQHVDAHWTSRAPESGTIYTNNPFFKTHAATTKHNFTSTMRQQPLGGTPITIQHSHVPNAGSVSGTVDQRNTIMEAFNQLTIFYGGSVNVYDDISPEKAQAIMFLAGNGSSVNPKTTSPASQVQASISRSIGGDSFQGNQFLTTSSCLSSPMSVTSQVNTQSGSGSNGADELRAIKSQSALTAPSNLSEPPVLTALVGSNAATMIPAAAAVPQARKASLARFLERRKERVMNKNPYNMNKNSSDCSTTSGSNGISLFGNTVNSVSVSKEQLSLPWLNKNDSSN
ncbi:Tify 6b [Thalictrum thalictroides]|uniref:Protein TIFY n=1 Tax=Thalictrum thalictroides TaxID=46969 RepID=A0A7J6VIX9_THATH|nr:Tify 6b [Thalictrum thalictroides]